MPRYVDRDLSGIVCSSYARAQREAHELLPDNHPDLVAFDSKLAEDSITKLADYASRETLIIRLKTEWQQAQDAFASLKARYDKLEAWACTKGYPG